MFVPANNILFSEETLHTCLLSHQQSQKLLMWQIMTTWHLYSFNFQCNILVKAPDPVKSPWSSNCWAGCVGTDPPAPSDPWSSKVHFMLPLPFPQISLASSGDIIHTSGRSEKRVCIVMKEGVKEEIKTGSRTDMLLWCEVLKDTFITAEKLKDMRRDVLEDAAVTVALAAFMTLQTHFTSLPVLAASP